MHARSHEFRFTLRSDGAVPTAEVIMRGELDFTVTQRLEEMFALVLGRHPRDVVLDMAEVTFVDCASARVIAAAAEALPGPGQLIIRPSSAAVRRLFEIVGLDVTIQSTQQHCLG